MRNDTLVASLINSGTDFGTDQRRQEIYERGLIRQHDEYIKDWKARMRAALQVSPMMGAYGR